MENLYIDVFFFQEYDPWSTKFIEIDRADSKILNSLWDALSNDAALTKNQASLLCKLIQKYKVNFSKSGVDLDQLLLDQHWSKEFRNIDLTKKISLEKDIDGVMWICLKFPYSLKSKFDEVFGEKNHSFWDNENRVRKLDLYKNNFLQVLDFAKKHQLEIDNDVINVADQIDEIWQNKDCIEKKSKIDQQEVNLINASESAIEYFNENKTDILEDNLLLAKELGHTLDCLPSSDIVQKICSTENNLFWTNDIKKFLDIHQRTSKKTCIILDRASDYKKWIESFIMESDALSIPREEIKVCFREDKNDSLFNSWIKQNNLGGKVESGRICIFLNTPAKWLYKELKSFKIIIVNSLFPNTNRTTQTLINHYPIVIYTGESKPSMHKESTINEL
jgi:hypothetical protein